MPARNNVVIRQLTSLYTEAIARKKKISCNLCDWVLGEASTLPMFRHATIHYSKTSKADSVDNMFQCFPPFHEEYVRRFGAKEQGKTKKVPALSPKIPVRNGQNQLKQKKKPIILKVTEPGNGATVHSVSTKLTKSEETREKTIEEGVKPLKNPPTVKRKQESTEKGSEGIYQFKKIKLEASETQNVTPEKLKMDPKHVEMLKQLREICKAFEERSKKKQEEDSNQQKQEQPKENDAKKNETEREVQDPEEDKKQTNATEAIIEAEPDNQKKSQEREKEEAESFAKNDRISSSGSKKFKEICDDTITLLKVSSRLKPFQDGSYQCRMCETSFQGQAFLKEFDQKIRPHVVAHLDPNPYWCSECNECFTEKSTHLAVRKHREATKFMNEFRLSPSVVERAKTILNSCFPQLNEAIHFKSPTTKSRMVDFKNARTVLNQTFANQQKPGQQEKGKKMTAPVIRKILDPAHFQNNKNMKQRGSQRQIPKPINPRAQLLFKHLTMENVLSSVEKSKNLTEAILGPNVSVRPRMTQPAKKQRSIQR